MTFRGKIDSLIHHPSILKDVIQGKSPEEIRNKIRAKIRSQDVMGRGLGEEVPQFISNLKKTSPYNVNPNDKLKLNRLCYVEDSENTEVRKYFLHYNRTLQEDLGNGHLQ